MSYLEKRQFLNNEPKQKEEEEHQDYEKEKKCHFDSQQQKISNKNVEYYIKNITGVPLYYWISGEVTFYCYSS
jgi:hypothetical protein